MDMNAKEICMDEKRNTFSRGHKQFYLTGIHTPTHILNGLATNGKESII